MIFLLSFFRVIFSFLQYGKYCCTWDKQCSKSDWGYSTQLWRGKLENIERFSIELKKNLQPNWLNWGRILDCWTESWVVKLYQRYVDTKLLLLWKALEWNISKLKLKISSNRWSFRDLKIGFHAWSVTLTYFPLLKF